MEYKLISVSTASFANIEVALENQVNQFIQAEWEPNGGVSTYIYHDANGHEQLVICQSMIKRN